MTLTPDPVRPTTTPALPVVALARAHGMTILGSSTGVAVTGVTSRSQDVRPGDLFVGLPGAASHGARYAAEAVAAGAVAVLTDAAGSAIADPRIAPILVARSPRAVLGAVAASVYRTAQRMPLLLGVTGTNGKTTTVHLLEHLLEHLGTPAGVSSTAERGSGHEHVPSRLTTPEADELHALLAQLSERGVRAAAIEVSAQALVRSRVDGLRFDVAGFTNLSHDHLDDFGSMDAYLAAKARLFVPARSAAGVISVDSTAGAAIARTARIPVTTVTTQDVDADWRVHDVRVGRDGTEFSLDGPDGERLTTRLGLLGRHQAANAALAIAMAVRAGVAFDRVAEAVHDGGLLVAMPGRLERVPGSSDPEVHLDVAHTPDAFAAGLSALRPLATGRLVAVFGADGDRDPTKRGPMGRAAAELADVVVVHDHHSRFEDPDAIRAMLLDGARSAGRARVLEVPDPGEAIRVAMAEAGEGGSVLWAGTGRTAYRDVAGVKRPYSFWDEARAAVAEGHGAP